MRKPLENARMKIRVVRDVVLGGQTFHPSDSVVAQATDSDRNRWHISYATGNAVCTVGWNELEQSKDRGFISYD